MSGSHTGATEPAGSVWERRLPMSRDRTSVLTRHEVAAAAFAVAETENLQAVSIKRVAGRLGIPAVRLQNYLADRSELLDLMVDEALGEIDIDSVLDSASWQVQLWQIAHAVRAGVQRRPWLSGLLGLRAPSGPNGLRFTERMLAATSGLGVDIASAAHCVQAVLSYVCGSVRPDAVSAPTGQASPAALAAYLATQVTPDRFPMISKLFDNAAAITGDEAFDTGLTYLLAGMAVDLTDVRDSLLRSVAQDART